MLIASTRTKKGLLVKYGLDKNEYQKGVKVTDIEMKEIQLKRHDFHGGMELYNSSSKNVVFIF